MQAVFNSARRTRASGRWLKAGALTCAMMSAGLVSFGARADMAFSSLLIDPVGAVYPDNNVSDQITESMVGPSNALDIGANVLVSLSNPGNGYLGETRVGSGTLLAYAPNVLGYSQLLELDFINTSPYNTSATLEPVFATNGCAQAVNELYSVDFNSVVDTTGSCLDHDGTAVANPGGNVLTLYATGDTSVCPTTDLGSCPGPSSTNGSLFFAGTIKGPGAVHIVNGNRPGSPLVANLTLVGQQYFAGKNTYTGGTVIESGFLLLGTGSVTGSIVGNVQNSGNLVFAPAASDPLTLSGVISDWTNGPGVVQTASAGTTILTGVNTYTGGTRVNSGTLQLGDGTTNGSIVGDVRDAALLVLDPKAGTTITLPGVISDRAGFAGGAVSQIGAGTSVLSGQNTYSGATTVTAGTLQAGAANALSPNSAVTVASGATLNLKSFAQSVPALTNSGTVNSTGAALTVNGDYTGGGTLIMSGKLNGSADDVLHVTGDTSGATVINYAGKLPATATTDDGILVVEVDGASDGTFTLQNDQIVANGFTYKLVQGTTNPNNWYLQTFGPQVISVPTPVPTLNETALALLAALLGLGAAALKRREG
jgi:fibronectin-binding autotransporter adhesin